MIRYCLKKYDRGFLTSDRGKTSKEKRREEKRGYEIGYDNKGRL